MFAHTAAVLSAIVMESKMDPSVKEYNEQMPRIKVRICIQIDAFKMHAN